MHKELIGYDRGINIFDRFDFTYQRYPLLKVNSLEVK